MKKSRKAQTKFIATVAEKKMDNIEAIAQKLKDDGVDVQQVSTLFGIISGRAENSIDELKNKYGPDGLSIEPDRDISI